MPRYYPIMLDLQHRRAVVIGGGEVAARKVETLLECGASVTVVARRVGEALRALAERIVLHEREYRDGDLAGAFVAYAATDDPAANARVRAEADRCGCLLNAVDDTPNCHFIVPAIVRRGELTIAIGTAGAAPALAARLRERFEREFDARWSELVELFARLRPTIMQRLPTMPLRRDLWYRVVDAALGALDAGQPVDAELESRLRELIAAG